jgi:hypothetical protein
MVPPSINQHLLNSDDLLGGRADGQEMLRLVVVRDGLLAMVLYLVSGVSPCDANP